MPVQGPQLAIPNTAERDEAGWPICAKCLKRLRAQFGGYGYNGSSNFCSMRCAADWADIKVESVQ